jgi:hypothetical protein
MAKGRKLKRNRNEKIEETGNKNPVPESGRIDQTNGETFTLFDSVQNRVTTDDALASFGLGM